jgi:hypothetical protein
MQNAKVKITIQNLKLTNLNAHHCESRPFVKTNFNLEKKNLHD